MWGRKMYGGDIAGGDRLVVAVSLGTGSKIDLLGKRESGRSWEAWVPRFFEARSVADAC
jgi:hypothetical protein